MKNYVKKITMYLVCLLCIEAFAQATNKSKEDLELDAFNVAAKRLRDDLLPNSPVLRFNYNDQQKKYAGYIFDVERDDVGYFKIGFYVRGANLLDPEAVIYYSARVGYNGKQMWVMTSTFVNVPHEKAPKTVLVNYW